VIDEGISITPGNCRPGDKILLSGRIAEHGIAIMSAREGLTFDTTVLSDTAPLNELVGRMLAASKDIHVMRDPTRGGVASALNEIAASANVGITIDEDRIPVTEEVKGACEILGLDPLYIANEGKLLAWVAPDDAERVLATMRDHPLGKDAVLIGQVVAEHPKRVVMKTSIGSTRIVDMISGEQLPRIC
jgi:hydrogenase expression/formation protein HypE